MPDLVQGNLFGAHGDGRDEDQQEGAHRGEQSRGARGGPAPGFGLRGGGGGRGTVDQHPVRLAYPHI
ncbi:hypothetical protein GCM10018779_38140 [Streptomyces griseocarneus]|nr:hypothetical protein GCM10018779_38140 [Streptomyces griseocarneus]